MNKGEAIDNGKLGIKVLDILPMECECLSCEPTFPRVRIGFYRPSDNRTLCEGEFFTGSATLNVVAKCERAMGVSVVSVNAINSKEQWVSFDLRK